MAANEIHTPQSIIVGEPPSSVEPETETAASQPVTGFEPNDRHAPAPDRVRSALETFQPAPPSEPATVVDPIGAVSDKERREHREKVDGIVQAQRDAETLVGISLRR
jgi:hypothetical protein